MHALPPVPVMETAYRRSDATYDGIFFLGVRTTGIFCRPTCAARKPLPRNVEYFATPREALFAGYRPCKRCEPLSAAGAPPPWVRTLLAEIDRDPGQRITDATLRTRKIDPARTRRYFLTHYGMTFQTYCRSRRLGKALEQIRKGAKLDDVLLGFGYDSHSGFRDAFTRTFGTPPGKARSTRHITLGWIESPLGPLLAATVDDRLILLEFTDRRMLEKQLVTIRRHFRLPLIPGNNNVLERLRTELQEYFAGKRKEFSVPLAAPGSEFQQRVWEGLRRIPYGATVSYEHLARNVKAPLASRAVGTANGLNRIAILIPCHRVIRKSGDLGGYGGGVWRKQALLEVERGKRQY